jgi:hypothetical protein
MLPADRATAMPAAATCFRVGISVVMQGKEEKNAEWAKNYDKVSVRHDVNVCAQAAHNSNT